MSKTQTAGYIITALSNMHPGRGDANYGIVDKQVQRDVIDPLPTIHSSGLKGAFRELFESYINPADNTIEEEIKKIFGSPKGDSGQSNQMQSGTYHFFNACMLTLPVRSNKQPFFRATSPELLREFMDHLDTFKVDNREAIKGALEELSKLTPKEDTPLYFTRDIGVILEDYLASNGTDIPASDYQAAEKILGERIALFNHATLKRLANELPIIARNSLENGESVNLWYEEVVPRETKFYFMVKYYDTQNRFDTYMAKSDHIAQVGGNASIGYGYSLIKNMDELLR